MEKVIEKLGEQGIYNQKGDYNSPSMNVGTDCKCADIVKRNDEYFVVGYGRNGGNEFETDDMGPFQTLQDAREEAVNFLSSDGE